MKRFENNRIAIDQGSTVMFSDFANNGPMWAGDGPRDQTTSVTFSEPYQEVPVVHVGISMWDMDGDTNQRADLRAERITTEGFQLVFRTWGDSRVARIRADWMAIGAVSDDDVWDID